MVELKIAIIKWIDSTYYKIEEGLVSSLPKIIKPRILTSSGILVYEDEESVCICQDLEPTEEYTRFVLTIPKISISYLDIFTKKIEEN